MRLVFATSCNQLRQKYFHTVIYSYSENLSIKFLKLICNSIEITANLLRLIVILGILPYYFVFKNENVNLENAKKYVEIL